MFQKWKVLVENESRDKVKVLETDRGREYTSTQSLRHSPNLLGHHKLTVPKTPEQNRVAERMTRT